MTKHVKYGGSTAARTIGCPSWHRLSEEVPVSVHAAGGNPAADTGTLLHNCMEDVYDSPDAMADVVQELLDSGAHYNDEKLTQELIDTKLTPAINCVEKLMDLYDVDDWLCEPYVEIAPDTAGSIDMLMRSADAKTVIVCDYKFGFVNVNVEHNAQLLFYALAAATDAKTTAWFEGVERIVLAIVQPNDTGEDCQTWEVTMATVDEFETLLIDAIEKAEEPETIPTSGPHCKYCPALVTCPEKTGLALKATRVNEITADKLAQYLPMAEELQSWIKEVFKLGHEQLELGSPIKGYKLVNKRSRRVWNDPTAVEDKVRKARKIKIEEGFDLSLKSVAQLEKVCIQKDVDFDKVYGQYISSLSSGTTIAKESDKRPAAIPVAGLVQLNALME